MKKVKEAYNLVDQILDEGFEAYGKLKKAEAELDKLLEMCGRVHKEQEDEDELDSGKADIETTGRPYDHPIKTGIKECEGAGMGPASKSGFVDSEFDEGPSKEDDPEKKQNVINTVPNQDIKNLYMAVRKQMQEYKNLSEGDKEAYKAFFNSMLKKFGVNSPANLPADKKKEFFNAVDAGWKAKNEQVIRRPSDSPSGGFGSIGGKSTSGGFGSISGRPREQDDLEDEEEEVVEGPIDFYRKKMLAALQTDKDSIQYQYEQCMKKAGVGGMEPQKCAYMKNMKLKALAKKEAKLKAKLAAKAAGR